VCLNGGYQGPNCDCVCPLGFGGAFCHESDGTVDPPVGPVSGCGYTFTDAVGEITSENYPNNYPDLIDCTYTIKGGEGASITIVFREFDLEDHATCDYDYLNVRSEGVAGDGSTYCGDQLPPVHYTYSNEMVLTFHSDPFVNGQGFRVTYFINGDLIDEEEEEEEETMTTVLPTTTTVVPTTATVTTTTNIPTTEGESDGEFVGTCGGYFGALSGNIASPNYPEPYPNNQVCFYTIQVPTGRRVELTFRSFDIDSTVICSGDYLRVDIGDGVEVPMKLCGSNVPEGSFVSLQNRLTLLLRADSTGSRSGFAAVYQTIDLDPQ